MPNENEDLEDLKNKSTDEEQGFFKDALNEPEDEDLDTKDKPDSDSDETEEQKKERSQKNKDAEEARKRKEAEAKEKKEADAKKLKESEQAKEEELRNNKVKAKDKQIGELGKQLDDFKKEHKDVDLKELDNDPNFKKFIDGKLLGKKNFTELYKDYVSIKTNLTGTTEEEAQKNYRTKAGSSSGSSKSAGTPTPKDIYTEKEADEIIERIPFMSSKKAEEALEKIERSQKYYKKK